MVEASSSISLSICRSFALINLAECTRLNKTQSHIKSIYVLLPCFHCALVPKKTDPHQKIKLLMVITLLMVSYFNFNSCLSNVQADLHWMILTLKLHISCMIHIKVSFSLNIPCVLKQVRIWEFLKKHFLLFYFFSKRKDKICSFPFLRFSMFYILSFPSYRSISSG